MEVVGMDLKLFWLFFGFLSVLPLILAVYTQKKADEREKNN